MRVEQNVSAPQRNQLAGSAAPMRFRSIEGLRGWLAWSVVLCHIRNVTLFSKGVGNVFTVMGDESVQIFIIISGFVITHLILEKQELYRVYIIRRFMRLFPLLFVTCAIGYFCLPLLSDALSLTSHGDIHNVVIGRSFSHIVNSQVEHFWSNFFAHLTMLHGAISNNLLAQSQYVFNPPAWSLSLEWQFYLVAPLIVLISRNFAVSVFVLAAMVFLGAAYDFGVFGSFEQRSLLFASAPLFGVGIASRIAYPELAGSLRHPAVVIALLIAQLALGSKGSIPFVIWGCVYTTLLADRQNLAPVDTMALELGSWILEGDFVIFMGKRSYSIYLCHMSIIGVVFFGLVRYNGNISANKAFIELLVTVFPLTLAFSCVLYRMIEKPGIAIGNLIASKRSAASFRTLPIKAA